MGWLRRMEGCGVREGAGRRQVVRGQVGAGRQGRKRDSVS